jgi:hypothetical protein
MEDMARYGHKRHTEPYGLSVSDRERHARKAWQARYFMAAPFRLFCECSFMICRGRPGRFPLVATHLKSTSRFMDSDDKPLWYSLMPTSHFASPRSLQRVPDTAAVSALAPGALFADSAFYYRSGHNAVFRCAWHPSLSLLSIHHRDRRRKGVEAGRCGAGRKGGSAGSGKELWRGRRTGVMVLLAAAGGSQTPGVT